MRILRLLSATSLLAALLVPAPASAGVAAVPAPGARPAALPQLVDVRAVHRGRVDRVVLQFDDGIPAGVDVRYVDRLLGDGSGLPIRIAGRAILQVGLHLTRTDRVTTAPARRAFATPNVMTVVRSGMFEGWTTYGVGLARRAPVAVVRQPARDRIVVSVGAGFRTVQRRVFFLDEDRFVANREPSSSPACGPSRWAARPPA